VSKRRVEYRIWIQSEGKKDDDKNGIVERTMRRIDEVLDKLGLEYSVEKYGVE